MVKGEKISIPAYVTSTALYNFIKDLRENGIPPHITRSVVKGSNSGKATMLLSLRYLGLINTNQEPTQELKQLVEYPENYSENLKSLLLSSYPFLFDGTIDLKNTVTEKVVEKFQAAGASGSTVAKCMAFFLGAAKVAQIEVSSRVKAPLPTVNTRKKKANAAGGNNTATMDDESQNDAEIPPDMDRITVPLRGMEDGIIYFPEGLEGDSAKRAIRMAVFILREYYGLEDDDS